MEILCSFQLFASILIPALLHINSVLLLLLSDTVTAMEDVWFVGDNFLRDIFHTFVEMQQYAIRKRKNPPYLYSFYNVFGYFQSKLSCVKGITRIYNAFLKGMNARKKLPRFIVFVMDKDLIANANYFGFGASLVLERIFEWLMKKVNANIQRRKADLFNIKPGALALTSTKVIWVRMIKRPYGSIWEFDKVFALCNRCNNAIENVLACANPQQYILSIKVDENDFHLNGELNDQGLKSFWNEIDTCLQLFDHDKINLKPKKQVDKDRRSVVPMLQPTQHMEKHRKLPTPPQYRKMHR